MIATSNGAGKLQEALLERFDIYSFSGGPTFASACQDRLAEIWKLETGQNVMPPGSDDWGHKEKRFSMRGALNTMGRRIAMMEPVAA